LSYSDLSNNQMDSGLVKLETSNQPILTVLTFVESFLPLFIIENRKSIKNEKGLTQRLLRILIVNVNDNLPFTFDKEGMQDESIGSSHTVDFSVIFKANRKEFFAFEAKILGVKEKYRKQEYLVGSDYKGNPKHCGGVERFKRNIHCKDLKYVGMLGYILKENSKYWLDIINKWINDFSEEYSDNTISWYKSEELVFLDRTDEISKLKSLHPRNNNSDITIYHFWCQLN